MLRKEKEKNDKVISEIKTKLLKKKIQGRTDTISKDREDRKRKSNKIQSEIERGTKDYI